MSSSDSESGDTYASAGSGGGDGSGGKPAPKPALDTGGSSSSDIDSDSDGDARHTNWRVSDGPRRAPHARTQFLNHRLTAIASAHGFEVAGMPEVPKAANNTAPQRMAFVEKLFEPATGGIPGTPLYRASDEHMSEQHKREAAKEAEKNSAKPAKPKRAAADRANDSKSGAGGGGGGGGDSKGSVSEDLFRYLRLRPLPAAGSPLPAHTSLTAECRPVIPQREREQRDAAATGSESGSDSDPEEAQEPGPICIMSDRVDQSALYARFVKELKGATKVVVTLGPITARFGGFMHGSVGISKFSALMMRADCPVTDLTVTLMNDGFRDRELLKICKLVADAARPAMVDASQRSVKVRAKDLKEQPAADGDGDTASVSSVDSDDVQEIDPSLCGPLWSETRHLYVPPRDAKTGVAKITEYDASCFFHALYDSQFPPNAPPTPTIKSLTVQFCRDEESTAKLTSLQLPGFAIGANRSLRSLALHGRLLGAVTAQVFKGWVSYQQQHLIKLCVRLSPNAEDARLGTNPLVQLFKKPRHRPALRSNVLSLDVSHVTTEKSKKQVFGAAVWRDELAPIADLIRNYQPLTELRAVFQGAGLYPQSTDAKAAEAEIAAATQTDVIVAQLMTSVEHARRRFYTALDSSDQLMSCQIEVIKRVPPTSSDGKIDTRSIRERYPVQCHIDAVTRRNRIKFRALIAPPAASGDSLWPDSLTLVPDLKLIVLLYLYVPVRPSQFPLLPPSSPTSGGSGGASLPAMWQLPGVTPEELPAPVDLDTPAVPPTAAAGAGSAAAPAVAAAASPAAKGKAAAVVAAWNCSACTFENNGSAGKCEMCETPKP